MGAGTAVGGALDIGGQILSLIGSSQVNKDRQKQIDRRRADITNIFDRDYNQDFLNSSENRSAIKLLSDRLKEKQLATDNTQAIMGGSDEAATAQKQSHARAFADMVNNLAARGTQRKDMAQRDYNAGMLNLDQRQEALNTEKNQNWLNLGKMAQQTGSSIATADSIGAFASPESLITSGLGAAVDAPANAATGIPTLDDNKKMYS